MLVHNLAWICWSCHFLSLCSRSSIMVCGLPAYLRAQPETTPWTSAAAVSQKPETSGTALSLLATRPHKKIKLVLIYLSSIKKSVSSFFASRSNTSIWRAFIGKIANDKNTNHICLAGIWARRNHFFYRQTKTNTRRGSNFSGILVYI